jgi:hypothetical protein
MIIRKSFFIFLISSFLIWFLGNCKAVNPSNPYSALSNNNIGWQETAEQLAGGNTVAGNLRTYFFYKDGSYQVVCEASDASCLVSNQNTGSWEYITDSTVQVSIFNGPILFYKIVQLTSNSLWFQDNNTKNQKILRELVPVSQ